MTREWTRRGLLAACGTSLAVGAGASAAATDQYSATIATNVLTEDGEPKLEVPTEQGVEIPMRTTCPEGTELVVRIRSKNTQRPFQLTPEATVGPDGRAAAVANFSDIFTGTPFKVAIFADYDDSRPCIGSLAHGDGLYEDLTGNGETDFGDVVELFQHREDPAVAKRVDAYDFDLDGDVDRADVVALFERV